MGPQVLSSHRQYPHHGTIFGTSGLFRQSDSVHEHKEVGSKAIARMVGLKYVRMVNTWDLRVSAKPALSGAKHALIASSV